MESTKLLRPHLAKPSFLSSPGRTLSEHMAVRRSWHGPALVAHRLCFHHAVRQRQGVGAGSQNLCYEKNQKPIQIQHINFLFGGRRKETEVTAGTKQLWMSEQGTRGRSVLKEREFGEQHRSRHIIWRGVAWHLGTQLYFQFCP